MSNRNRGFIIASALASLGIAYALYTKYARKDDENLLPALTEEETIKVI